MEELRPHREEIVEWVRRHPDGYLVLYYDNWPIDWRLPRAEAEYAQDYRGDFHDLALWSAQKLSAAQ